eukprot:Skav208975  [mRNA]  locus=scaffold1039:24877:25305:+ [translate_table: standard]
MHVLPKPPIELLRSSTLRATCMHAAYLDDRTWTSATATERVNIADAGSAETQCLGLDENRSKLEFSAVGGKQNTTLLRLFRPTPALKLWSRKQGPRPKILGTRLILDRRHAGAVEEESKAVKMAVHLTAWIRSLRYTLEEKK